jgi:hypothetical protein
VAGQNPATIFIQTKIKIMNQNEVLLVSSVIKKYTKMKSLFNNTNDSELRENIIYVINNVIVNNINIPFEYLVKQYGKECANATVVVLFGAYLDGYLDNKSSIVKRLYSEREKYNNKLS